MNCNCIRGEGEFNFKIERFSSDAFLYQDLSWWNTDNNYTIPTSYTIQITTPASETFDVEIFVKTSEIDVPVWNKITNKKLGGVLKDGVYCVSFENCDYNYKRYFVFANKIECCIEEMIMKENVDEENPQRKELQDLLKKGISLAKFGNFKDAKYLIEKRAMKIVNQKCNCL